MKLISSLFVILGCTIFGSLLAGGYGIIHDQITFTLAPEYFTNLKFKQFAFANVGWPTRFFVAEIGFLATWWVGFISALILSTLACLLFPWRIAIQRSLTAFLILIASALLAGIIGGVLGQLRRNQSDLTDWQPFVAAFQLSDLPAFVQVAYIHNASYLGGVVGLLIGIGYLITVKVRKSRQQGGIT